MFKQLMFLAVATPILCNPVPLLEDRQTSSCVTGVHIIVARASGEQQGEGIIGQVASNVVNQIPGSDSIAVNYPATLYNYQSSESQGVTAMTNLIEQYTSSCPNSKIVLMGYSQVRRNTFGSIFFWLLTCVGRSSDCGYVDWK
jgi:hypothetical protein